MNGQAMSRRVVEPKPALELIRAGFGFLKSGMTAWFTIVAGSDA
jgi:hypothetical protein